MQVKLNLQKFPFPEARNKVAFLIVSGGKLLLHRKPIYPAGCFRIPTGDVKPGESWEEALKRELKEEFGISVKKADYQQLEEIDYLINQKGNTIKFKERIYLVNADGKELKVNEKELGEIKWVSFDDLLSVYRRLKWVKGEWKYWGRLRSVLHRVVYELYKQGKIKI